MAFRKISYLIPSCDGCGLAWSFSTQPAPRGFRRISPAGPPPWSSCPAITAGRSAPAGSAAR
jgi:hypothetical protein